MIYKNIPCPNCKNSNNPHDLDLWLITKPSHASDDLCQIGKESIQNCMCCRVDTEICAIFQQFYCKVRVEWPCRFDWRPWIEPWRRSRSKFIMHNTFSHASDYLCQLWKELIQNCRTLGTVEQTLKDVSYFSRFIAMSWLNDFEDVVQGQRSWCATHHVMLVIICA